MSSSQLKSKRDSDIARLVLRTSDAAQRASIIQLGRCAINTEGERLGMKLSAESEHGPAPTFSWRRDFAAIGGATSPQAEARRGENAGSQSCRSLRATARPSALHSAVLTLRLTPELEVSRAGRRSSWSAAWQCGCTAYASAAGDERTPAWGMSASDSRFRAEAEYKLYGDATDNTMHL